MIITMHRTYSYYKIGYTSFLIIISSLIITVQFPPALAGVNSVDQDGDGYYYDPPSGIPPDPDDQNPCVPDENSEACITQDPLEAIDDVMNEVNDLISSGDFDINSAQAKSLLTKLKNAMKNIEADKINVAINNLNAFNNQVNAYINSGQILPEDGQALISEVNNIINYL